MDLKRKIAGHTVTFLAVLASIVSLQQRWIAVTEISAAIAFALVGVATGGLYWAWRPEINHWFAERNQPKLTVVPEPQTPEQEVKEIHVRLRGGDTERHEARFYFVRISNMGRATAEDVEAFYAPRGYPFLLVPMPIAGKAAVTVDSKSTLREFERKYEKYGSHAFVGALIKDEGEKFRRTVTVHPKSELNPGPTFALFFTLKDYPQLCIPSPTLIYRGFERPVLIDVFLEAKKVPLFHAARYELTVKNWKEFEVREVKVATKRS